VDGAGGATNPGGKAKSRIGQAREASSRASAELPTNCYRVDPRGRSTSSTRGSGPDPRPGVSPDYKKLYD